VTKCRAKTLISFKYTRQHSYVSPHSAKSISLWNTDGSHGVLHRVDLVAGQTIEQLVLQENRRQQAVDLAHETFGAHTGYKFTAKRLRDSFWWPSMARDTKTSVSRCDRCVRRARMTCFDRVPIKNVERGSTPFNY